MYMEQSFIPKGTGGSVNLKSYSRSCSILHIAL
jgi:hypothetical protein